MSERVYSVYILANDFNSVLYIGVTGNIVRRVYAHKQRAKKSLTRKYHVTKLVYFEDFQDPGAAIYREKQLKGWLREKKIILIKRQNPDFNDLASGWY